MLSAKTTLGITMFGLNPEKPTFNMEFLYNKSSGYIVEKNSKIYGSAITKYSQGNLECLLKVVCFTFHPEM